MKLKIAKLLLLLFLFGGSIQLRSQSASISEESRIFTTYPFNDPNPIPILADNPKIYPYHKFEGYSHESSEQAWKVVTLENDYIQVFVLPEVGGKVWGAIDKTTGQEFIYRNEVMKFRNISMRGPWTSGGIEFNFGIIGHHPSTATPVDYVIRQNDDGSVSCIVGNIDLPSRTQWRVNITLSPDKSYFETKSLWFNPTPNSQSYYNWMTAAAFATDDLEFFTPGNQYLKHSGEAMPWPIDVQGHNRARYSQNNFGGSKSYHVVGAYNDFFGGYFHNDQYGFGHWSTYEEMPGQKLWIWALSRSGGIWEDLLTDSDGQYIEFQAGRLFDQYSPDTHKNPITQVPFGSYYADSWKEIWFPFNQIGGLTEVSPKAAMHITSANGQIQIGINALSSVNGTLLVRSGGQELLKKSLTLKPQQIVKEAVPVPNGAAYEVSIPEMDLLYQSDGKENLLKRPFEYAEFQQANPSTEAYRQALEELQYREIRKAKALLEQCLKQDPYHVEARVWLADILFRNAEYQQALDHVHLALSIDTYRPHSNYVAGNIYRAMDDYANAMESFGWAARSMEFRSAAYTQMAELAIAQDRLEEAKQLVKKGLNFNQMNIAALQAQAVAARLSGNQQMASETLSRLLELDPLNHLAHYEMSRSSTTYDLNSHFRSEFAEQTYIELAVHYFNLGQTQWAMDILSEVDHSVARLWMAYLHRENVQESSRWLQQVKDEGVEFAFPFRRETVDVLEWAEQSDSHWKFKYYLGLLYWDKNRLADASRLMNMYRSNPDQAVFYLSRALLLKEFDGTDQLQDLEKAMNLDPDNWRIYSQIISYHTQRGNYQQELELAEAANRKWPDNYDLGLSYARSLMHNQQYSKCISQLNKINLLPFEGADESRNIYERAHLGEAISLMERGQHKKAIALLEKGKQWPENLGVGKPYSPEQRQIDYLQGVCYQALGQKSNFEVSQKALQDYTLNYYDQGHPANILGLMSLENSGKNSQAENIIKELGQSEQLSDQWVVAQYHGDESAIIDLSPRLNQVDPVGYELLRQIIQLQ
jgi:predicted Zn-dependent protease